MSRLLRTAAFAVLAAHGLGSSAWAAEDDEPILTVAPLRGPGGAACAKKLSKVLAKQMPVEAWDDTRGVAGFESFMALARFIEARGKALGAQIVVVGTSSKKKLILEAYDVESGALLGLSRVPVPANAERCTVGTRGRARVVAFAQRALKAYLRRHEEKKAAAQDDPAELVLRDPAPPAETPPPAPPPPAPTPTGTATVAEAPPPPPPEDDPFDGADGVFRDDLDLPPTRPSTAQPPPPPRAPALNLVEIELEVGLSQRSLTFEAADQTQTANLQIGALFTPGLRARVAPWRKGRSWLAPLAAELVFRSAPTVKTGGAATNEGRAPDVRYVEAAGYLRYPVRIPESRFVLSPEIGGHFMQYDLRRHTGASLVDDALGTAYGSLLLGVGLEANVVEQADVRLSGAYVPVLSGGPIFSSAGYPDGSAWALRIEAALTVHVTSWLLVVVTGHYTGYSLDLKSVEGPSNAANDRTTGLRLGIRIGL